MIASGGCRDLSLELGITDRRRVRWIDRVRPDSVSNRRGVDILGFKGIGRFIRLVNVRTGGAPAMKERKHHGRR